MATAFSQLDAVLRGDALRPDQLRDNGLQVRARGLALLAAGLGVVYGLCMGSFSLFRVYGEGAENPDAARDAWLQLLASAVKLPLLFLLTLAVTLPSLYVFSVLVGSRLSFRAVLRVLVAMLGVTLAVLASLGPIVAFFGLSTTSYHFMLLLNVVMCALAGVLGLAFLLRTLRRVLHVQQPELPPLPAPPEAPTDDSDESTKKAYVAKLREHHATVRQREQFVRQRDGRAKLVFNVWVLVFALVGAQMSWVLRPFVGHPDLAFSWLRPRDSNFFQAVLGALGKVLGF